MGSGHVTDVLSDPSNERGASLPLWKHHGVGDPETPPLSDH